MATIKDVAKLANVSLGSVSNVINGKTKNEDLIERVEAAMRQLSYRPDATARSLKNTKTNIIGLVIPDVQQQRYQEFVMEIERQLRTEGYNLLVKFSRNNRHIEKKSIESFLEQRVDGVIVYSTLPQRYNDGRENTDSPMVLITRRADTEFFGDKIIIDCSMPFHKVMQEMRESGLEKVGMVIEQDLLCEGSFYDIYREYYKNERLIKVVDGSKERGFQAFFELYDACPELDGIIVGSHVIGEGVKKAMQMLRIDIPVYAIKESGWIEDIAVYSGEISVSQKRVAQEAVSRLIDAIEVPQMHENIIRHVYAQFDSNAFTKYEATKLKTELRFAMYDCSSARSLKMLSTVYERETGQKIRFDMYSYGELEQILYKQAAEKEKYYDGFMIDITWLGGLVESGVVKKLDQLLEEHNSYFSGFVDGIMKDYGMYENSLYAVPFMPGAQMLFYQKDLFEDRSFQIRFQRKYKERLQPPASWPHFNAIAEFFTREYTPDSPVQYGVSMSMGGNVYMAIDFLDRLWSYGGSVFDEFGRVSINRGSAADALKSLMRSYKYSSGRMLSSWDEVADEFSKGDSAMVILYNSDVGHINNYTKSRVAGNLGYSLIPGGTPVLGGWTLGLNSFGNNTEEAERFLLWACGYQDGVPISLLGGSTLRKAYYERSDLENLEPWKNCVLESSRQSRKRVLPEMPGKGCLTNNIYTAIIPGEIMRVKNGELSETEALEQMKRKIEQLIG